MRKKTKRWLTFWYPGTFFGESKDQIVKGEFAPPSTVEFPDGAYAFRQMEREDIIDDGGETYKGVVRSVGPLYYHPDSKIRTLDEVRVLPEEVRGWALVKNMECNCWDSVIFTRYNNWPQPWDPNCMEVIDASF